jgi:uncharacterized protein YgbK (DUF1537 family)
MNTEVDTLTALDVTSLPTPWSGAEGLADRIAAENKASGRLLVVLDDDPTGSQAVHDVPILTRWDVADVAWAFGLDTPMVFILTNSRSLDQQSVATLITEILDVVDAVATTSGRRYSVMVRGDSTLRGHFPLETDIVTVEMTARGHHVRGVLLAPAFPESGRVTVHGVHYAMVGDAYLPVGQTDYARDATFGYRSSRLIDYVQERSGQRYLPDSLLSITIDDLRCGGPDRVAEVLRSAPEGCVVACDAVSREDLDVLAAGQSAAESTGTLFVVRCGPSYVAARAGMRPTPPVKPPAPPTGRHGLVVVGSHVALTGRQLARLREVPGISFLELDVERVLNGDTPGLVADVTSEAVNRLTTGDVCLLTSRTRVDGPTPAASLEIARGVSTALVDSVAAIRSLVPLAWVVAKGGITSHDTAIRGLGIHRAMVAGQLFPGKTSLWTAVSDDGNPTAMSYVVFPGNVGDDGSLAEAVHLLRGGPLTLPTATSADQQENAHQRTHTKE